MAIAVDHVFDTVGAAQVEILIIVQEGRFLGGDLEETHAGGSEFPAIKVFVPFVTGAFLLEILRLVREATEDGGGSCRLVCFIAEIERQEVCDAGVRVGRVRGTGGEPFSNGEVAIVVIGIHEDRDPELLEVIQAGGRLSFAFGPSQGRHQHGSENPDDGDDHE